MRLVLASASPRRKALLAQIGVRFEVQPAHIDESPLPEEAPQPYVARMALEKARACFQQLGAPPDCCVLGADTTVAQADTILGKPEHQQQAATMLRDLSARQHQVLTAIALITATEEQVETVITDVWFHPLSDAMIERYWHSGEPQDKAGAYGIQGLGAVFVKRLEGSYSAVVGLPLAETAQHLQALGVPIWQHEVGVPNSEYRSAL